MKKEYPVIEVQSDGGRGWYEGARCMFFVYSKHSGNFIVKGYRREVEEYLKKNYTHYFYYVSMWYKGCSRGHWKFWKNDVSIFEPSRVTKTFKYKVVKYGKGYPQKRVLEVDLKRLPKRWIPEFDKF